MTQSKAVTATLSLMLAAALFAPAEAQRKGKGGSEVQGGSKDAAANIEKCDQPMGTLAVVEPQDYTAQALSRFGLPSPTGLIRLIVQQSNCFQLVERGMAMQNIMQERSLQSGGQLQRGQNMGQGQMVTADYILTPDVAFSEGDAGGAGAALGLLPGKAGAIGGLIGGGIKNRVAQTSMVLADTRTTLQVAAAEGSAKATDFALGGLLGGGGVGGGLGGYTKTPEGKVIASSFVDNWNNIVRAVRGNLAPSAAAAAPTVGAGVNPGDVLVAKIKGVKVFANPDKASKVVTSTATEFVYMGEESGGFFKVASPDGEGWVEAILVNRQ
jgi:curli biogenesis system outer membrane secretion channel CsgG